MARQVEWLLSRPLPVTGGKNGLSGGVNATKKDLTNGTTVTQSNEKSFGNRQLYPLSARRKSSLSDISPSNPVIDDSEIRRKSKAMKQILDYYVNNREDRSDPLDFCKNSGIRTKYPNKCGGQERFDLKTCNKQRGQVLCREEKAGLETTVKYEQAFNSDRRGQEMAGRLNDVGPYYFMVKIGDGTDYEIRNARHLRGRLGTLELPVSLGDETGELYHLSCRERRGCSSNRWHYGKRRFDKFDCSSDSSENMKVHNYDRGADIDCMGNMKVARKRKRAKRETLNVFDESFESEGMLTMKRGTPQNLSSNKGEKGRKIFVITKNFDCFSTSSAEMKNITPIWEQKSRREKTFSERHRRRMCPKYISKEENCNKIFSKQRQNKKHLESSTESTDAEEMTRKCRQIDSNELSKKIKRKCKKKKHFVQTYAVYSSISSTYSNSRTVCKGGATDEGERGRTCNKVIMESDSDDTLTSYNSKDVSDFHEGTKSRRNTKKRIRRKALQKMSFVEFCSDDEAKGNARCQEKAPSSPKDTKCKTKPSDCDKTKFLVSSNYEHSSTGSRQPGTYRKVTKGHTTAFDGILAHPVLSRVDTKFYRDTRLKRAANEWWSTAKHSNKKSLGRGTKQNELWSKKECKLKHYRKGVNTSKLKPLTGKLLRNYSKKKFKFQEEETSINFTPRKEFQSIFQFDENQHRILSVGVDQSQSTNSEAETSESANVKSKDFDSSAISATSTAVDSQSLKTTNERYKNQGSEISSFLKTLCKSKKGTLNESKQRLLSDLKDNLIQLILQVLQGSEDYNDKAKKNKKMLRLDSLTREENIGLQKVTDQEQSSSDTSPQDCNNEALKASNSQAINLQHKDIDEVEPVKTKMLAEFEDQCYQKQEIKEQHGTWHKKCTEKNFGPFITQNMENETKITMLTTLKEQHFASNVTQPNNQLGEKAPSSHYETRLPLVQTPTSFSGQPHQYQTVDPCVARTPELVGRETAIVKSSTYQCGSPIKCRVLQDQNYFVEAGNSPYNVMTQTYSGTVLHQPGKPTSASPPSQSSDNKSSGFLQTPQESCRFFPEFPQITPQSDKIHNHLEEYGMGGSIHYRAVDSDDQIDTLQSQKEIQFTIPQPPAKQFHVIQAPSSRQPPQQNSNASRQVKGAQKDLEDTPCRRPCCCNLPITKDSSGGENQEKRMVTCGNENFQMRFPMPDCESNKQVQIKVPRQMFAKATCKPKTWRRKFVGKSKPRTNPTRPRVIYVAPYPTATARQPLNIRVECNGQGASQLRGRGRNNTLVIPDVAYSGGAPILSILRNLRTLIFGGGCQEVSVPRRCRPKRTVKPRQPVEPEPEPLENVQEEDALGSWDGGTEQGSFSVPLQLYNLRKIVEGGANLVPDMLRQFILPKVGTSDPVQSKFIKRCVKSYLNHHFKRQRYEEKDRAKNRQLQLLCSYLGSLERDVKGRYNANDSMDVGFEIGDNVLSDESDSPTEWGAIDEGSDVEYLKKSTHWAVSDCVSSLPSRKIARSENVEKSMSSSSTNEGKRDVSSTWKGLSSTQYYVLQ